MVNDMSEQETTITEPDNSTLLDLYNNNPKARELIDTFVNSAPHELALKLGLPQEREH